MTLLTKGIIAFIAATFAPLLLLCLIGIVYATVISLGQGLPWTVSLHQFLRHVWSLRPYMAELTIIPLLLVGGFIGWRNWRKSV